MKKKANASDKDLNFYKFWIRSSANSILEINLMEKKVKNKQYIMYQKTRDPLGYHFRDISYLNRIRMIMVEQKNQ